MQDGTAPTTMLAHWARDRTQGTGQIPIEICVQKQARDTAYIFNLHDRGTPLLRHIPTSAVPESALHTSWKPVSDRFLCCRQAFIVVSTRSTVEWRRRHVAPGGLTTPSPSGFPCTASALPEGHQSCHGPVKINVIVQQINSSFLFKINSESILYGPFLQLLPFPNSA